MFGVNSIVQESSLTLKSNKDIVPYLPTCIVGWVRGTSLSSV